MSRYVKRWLGRLTTAPGKHLDFIVYADDADAARALIEAHFGGELAGSLIVVPFGVFDRERNVIHEPGI